MLSEEERAEARWRRWSSAHLLPLLLYLLLSLAVSWPMPGQFNEAFLGSRADPRNNLWLLWHVKEFVLGHHALFDTNLLYYPEGISLLLRGLGPFVGFISLPFWLFLGPAGVYNASIMLQFVLTSYFSYLLAAELKLSRPIAFLVGVMVLMAPLHIAGFSGHMTKTFLGLIPLALLCLIRALTAPGRWQPYAWGVATGLSLLALLSHNGYQFVFTALTLPLLVLLYGWLAPAAERQALLGRALVAALSCALFCLPLLLAIQHAADTSNIVVDLSNEAQLRRPDFIELFIPSHFHFLWGEAAIALRERVGITGVLIERTVYLVWTQLLLLLLALRRGGRLARFWAIFALVWALLSLGPTLRFFGQDVVPLLNRPLPLPYRWLVALPGLGFMRVPGRVMMIGSLATALAAGYGLKLLTARFSSRRHLLLAITGALILLETWPAPRAMQTLRPLPVPYADLAEDPDEYGIADLPFRGNANGWVVGFSATYQLFQMEHGKPIMMGYVARSYDHHPTFPCLVPAMRPVPPAVFVDGEPADCAANFRFDLVHSNYRYLTFHKTLDLPFRAGRPEDSETWPIVQRFFAGETPLYEDEQVVMYAVTPIDPAGYKPTIGLMEGWQRFDGQVRRAVSPATLFLSAPVAADVMLLLEIDTLDSADAMPLLSLTLDDVPLPARSVTPGQTATIPLTLSAGPHRLQVGLTAPAGGLLGEGPPATFTVSRIELLTAP